MINTARIEKLYELFDQLIECGDFNAAHQVLALVDTLRYQDEYDNPTDIPDEATV